MPRKAALDSKTMTVGFQTWSRWSISATRSGAASRAARAARTWIWGEPPMPARQALGRDASSFSLSPGFAGERVGVRGVRLPAPGRHPLTRRRSAADLSPAKPGAR